MTARAFWERTLALQRQLSAWALGSVAVGALLVVVGGPLLRAVGVQFLIWGAIDGAIARLAARDRRRALRAGAAGDVERTERERRRVRRLLLVNVGLDLGYLFVGAALLGFDAGPVRTGHGLGVLVQGGFLLAFDAVHAARLRGPVTEA